MKFFIDHNLPIPLAESLHALISPLGHKAIHLTVKFPANTPDVKWIQTLTQEKNWVILTQDLFRQHEAERKALIQSGLVVYWLKGKGWNRLQLVEKNLAVIEWTKAMIDHAEPVLSKAQQSGIGSAWSMRYKPNTRKFNFDSESLT